MGHVAFEPPLRIVGKGEQVIRSLPEWREWGHPASTTQWKDGRSAKEVARAWVGRSTGPKEPDELTTLFKSDKATSGMTLGLVRPEARLKLDDFRGNARNTDVLAHGWSKGGATLITIEAKADEPFGPTIESARSSAKPKSNIPERIDKLCKLIFGRRLGNPPRLDSELKSLRYQLLHALAGTIYEARRKGADQAVLVVHEFKSNSTAEKRLAENHRALEGFVKALRGPNIREGELVRVQPKGVPFPLYIGRIVTELP